MNWIKKNFEILIGYLFAVLLFITGSYIIIKFDEIAHFKNIAVNKMHMYSFFDFINIYAYEFLKIISNYVHGFALLYGLLLVALAVSFVYISRKLKKTTMYDQVIAYFYLLISILLFIIVTILMFEVYGFTSLLYLLFFIVVVYFTMNRKKLNGNYRKLHYIVLIILYSIAYFFTQHAVYSNLQKDKVSPIDVMSINFFIIVLVTFATLALVNYVFLKRTLPVKHPRTDELSRVDKKKKDKQISRMISKSTNSTIEKLSVSTLKTDEKMMYYFEKFKDAIKRKINLQEDDIPGWMKRPQWLRAWHIELLFSGLILLLTLIELNNRNILFGASKMNVVKMKYFYEWINMIGFLAVIILYMYFTVMIVMRKKGYFGQLFTVSFLVIKIYTALYLTVFKGVNLALFIAPILVMIAIIVFPLLIMHLRKKY